MKRIVYNMIEQGYNNADIAAAVDISIEQIRNMRRYFNQISPVKFKSRPSKRIVPSIPKEGTMSRSVYDLIKQGVEDIHTIIAETGAPHGVIHSVRIKFFGYQPKKPTYQRFNAMRTIDLSELRP